jgi:two-component system, LytTR family, sensor histidine kinase AlgZ
MAALFADHRRLGASLMALLPLAAVLAVGVVRPAGLSLAHSLLLSLPLAAISLALLLPVWYVCRALPLATTPPPKLVLSHGLAAAAASVAWVSAGSVAARAVAAIASRPDLAPAYRRQAAALLPAGALLYLLAAALHYVLLAFAEARRAERQAMELRVLAREAELRALRAQVHPHFLFNSLNSISALTTRDPALARETCLLLAEYLRQTLAAGDKASVALEEELGLARTYLAIEGVRLGARLALEESCDQAGPGCRVPPLLLQPLVENAVRHGVATRVEGGVVRLSATRGDGRLRLVVENPRDPDAPPRPGAGLGLANVRQRLQARYGAEARFEAVSLEEGFRVAISIPAEGE